MHHIFSLSSSDYVPISVQGQYLFDKYEHITSYLRSKMQPKDLDRLLKPARDGGKTIKWFGVKKMELMRLSELDDSISLKIKREFADFCNRASKIAEPLLISKDPDSREWGDLIRNLFTPEKIILVGTTSGEWAMLWGWHFKSQEENKIPELSRDVPPVSTGTSNTDLQGASTANPTGPDIASGTNVPPVIPPPIIDPIIDPDPSKKVGCLGRIVRLLRWISYRFWALFWLIIYTLLIILLCRYFFRPDCSECCDQLEKTKVELQQLEQKIRERCDTATFIR